MQFSDWISAVAALLSYDATITNAASATPSSNTNFNTIYPRAIEYAEQRMYRELDSLNTRFTDTTGRLVANNRTFSLPSTFVVLEQIAVYDGNGVKQPPLLPVAKDYVEYMWPNDTAPTTPSLPTVYAMIDDQTVLLGPSPDTNYQVLCYGTQRPVPLSSTQRTTFLTTFLPDAFLAATMIFFSGYQRDFGAESADPAQATSWEQVYAAAIQSANIEELRKKHQAQGWTTRLPSPIATPPQH